MGEQEKSYVGEVIGGLVVLGLVLVLALTGFKTIKTGELGIESRFGKVVGTREAGLNFYFRPTTKIKTIKVTQDKFENTYEVSTKDTQSMNVSMAVQYIVNQPMAVDLYTKFGTEYVDGILAPKVAEAVNYIIGDYTITEVISERAEIADSITERIKGELEPYGIDVVSADITDHDFSDIYEAAVEAKMAAEQETLKAKQENQKIVDKAQKELEAAEIKARETVVKAQADAEANRLRQASLTDKVLQELMIKGWDGKLPEVVSDSAVIKEILGGKLTEEVAK